MSPDFEVEVGACHIAGMTTQADDLTIPDLFSGSDIDRGKMRVDRQDLSGVLQPDDLAITALNSSKTNPAFSHGPDLSPIRDVKIHTTMDTQGEPTSTEAEGGGKRPLGGPPGGATRRGVCEATEE